MEHTRPTNNKPKLKLKKELLYELDDIYFSCLDNGYTLEKDYQMIKNFLIVNTIHYKFNLDNVIELYLQGYYESF